MYDTEDTGDIMAQRAHALAQRLEEGATRLAAFAESLSDRE